MEQVKIGVVGIGNMGTSHCHKLFENKVARGQFVAACDTKQSRLDYVKENFEGVATFNTIEELIESKLCDALIIATPHYDHPSMGILGLNNDLHMLVEKPIGVYSKAVQELNKVANNSSKVFTIMYNQRTNPVYKKAKEMVSQGDLGRLIRVNWVISNWFRSETYYASGGWRATWEGEGGGVLLNQCPHQIDLLQWICGMPKRVRSFAKYGHYHNIEVEDDVTAYLEYENGASGVFISSTGEAPGTNRLEISGSLGKLVIEDNDGMTFYKNKVDCLKFSKTSDQPFAKPEIEVITVDIEGESTDHVGIMQSFVNAILDGSEQLAPGVEGINGLSLSNAIHMSSWTDQWVEFPLDENKFYDLLQEKINSSEFVKVTKETVLDVKGSH